MRREWAYLLFGCLVLGVILASNTSAEIPAGWSSRDISTTGGGANEAGGTWTVSGDGADIWGSSDAFHFVYLPMSGNGQITARVVSPGSGSNTWSKGGVMIRETLAPNSKHALMAITGGEGGGLAFQNRPITGGRSYSAHGNPTAAAPYWVRLKREGDTITAYSSVNGVDWVQQPEGVGTNATPNPVIIPMAADVFAGLFVTSHRAGEIRTYTFDNVTVVGPVTAMNPEPEDGAMHPDTWAELSWLSGSTADSHDVYFGESFTDVTVGTGGTFRGNQRSTSLVVGLPGSPYPDGLVPETTYYWRVDEFDGYTTHKGDVWSFTTKPDYVAAATVVVIPKDGDWASSINALQPGDIGQLESGRYLGRKTITVSGTPDKPIIIRGAGRLESIFDGESGNWAIRLDNCSNLIIENITVTNPSPIGIDGRENYSSLARNRLPERDPGYSTLAEGMIIRGGGSRITIRRSFFVDIATRGIFVGAGGVDDLTVEHNIFIRVSD
ncbi:MAG: right-handed parallel beta-helix repeat-containing protein, partial [Planctomycetota bacterium]